MAARANASQVMSRVSLFGLLAFISACGAHPGSEPVGHSAQAITVCASGSVVQGVDVSVYQGSIDWASVKGAGIDFAIARISDGSSLDTEFANNWSGMKSQGLVRGAYQYFEPGEDPTTQANIVISAVGTLGDGDLPVTADMETTGGQSASTIAANLKTWADAVTKGTGKTPMIYTALGYWNSDVGSSAFAANPLWVANWGVSCPDLATGWSTWSVWQYSDSGSVAGISGGVDLDEFNGTLAQLQAFAGGGSSPSDAGPPAAYYAAGYVSQSWPLASTSMPMNTCDTVAASITLKNTGTSPWDSNTRLATTQPRDRKSLFADSTWLANDRVAAVSGTVMPGDTFEFKFNFHAPPTAGSYLEYFGLVQEGVAWFSDPGQGGPPDNDIEANIQVAAGSSSCMADPGVPDASPPPVDAGHSADAGVGSSGDAGKMGSDAGVKGDAAGAGRDGGAGGSDAAENLDPAWNTGSGGCSASGSGVPAYGAWPSAAALLLLARRKRRSRGRGR